MTVAEALQWGAGQLTEGGIPNAAGDARWLLADALGVEPMRITLMAADPVAAEKLQQFQAHIAARQQYQPVAQIIGHRMFYGRRFRVTPDVLDPRPDTETLIEVALQAAFRRVLDLGVGSGCILLTLLAEQPDATGTGTDISDKALAVARQNMTDLGLSDRARLVQSDWLTHIEGVFDLIVSNPPYISTAEMADLSPDVTDWEPHVALTPGGDGLDAYRIITRHAADYLTPGGRLIVEIGAGQGDAVRILFQNAKLDDIVIHSDLDGRDRVVSGKIGKKIWKTSEKAQL
ncbi:peptide chain release factor N(5)-glutamine methyltransferase [Pseudaestuariivita rosea]|uniref:peptide chain release factor N(5)-glutamine methyltransferase n=1 Tax=Pseudaestuariivita rosea TaxID=2763263 RepID=UPI001ABB94FD|nr:peptide chain release factor N(5)-glutamine methyltransferase [Pseudaestuariivita rosea]